jgi:hypothetical protein
MKLPIRHVEQVYLNTSAEEQLDREVGLGPERARRIVENRPFRDWDDLARVEGFTAQVVAELRASGAQLGDADNADIKPISDEHRRTLQREQTAGVDPDEGVPVEGKKGKGPPTRVS